MSSSMLVFWRSLHISRRQFRIFSESKRPIIVQVQFRLQQISKAEATDRERMITELEQFAFQGCPNVLDAVKETHQRRRSSLLLGDDESGERSDH